MDFKSASFALTAESEKFCCAEPQMAFMSFYTKHHLKFGKDQADNLQTRCVPSRRRDLISGSLNIRSKGGIFPDGEMTIKMDLIKTGNFISELRKEKGMTQAELGEKLGVTNKTVSRWETGVYMPPADILLSMSELFSVSINEILYGERLNETEFKQAAEENIIEAVEASSFTYKEKMAYYKKKWEKEHIAEAVLSVISFCALYALGLLTEEPLINAAAAGLTVVWTVVFNNRKMGYAEKRTYEKSKKE